MDIEGAVNTCLYYLKQPSIQENLVVLSTNVILSAFTSVLFSTVFGTPRLHSTIKMWSESLTRVHFAVFSFYAYLVVTYNDTRFIFMFLAMALLLVGLSGFFTKKINSNIEILHKCTFTKTACVLQTRKDCKVKETIIDPHSCLTYQSYWTAFKIISANFLLALAGIGIALFTCFLFSK